MLFRSSSIRGLVILIIVNVFIYAFFLRRTSTNNNDDFLIAENRVFDSPSISGNQQSISLPTIFENTPMYDELAELQFYPVR